MGWRVLFLRILISIFEGFFMEIYSCVYFRCVHFLQFEIGHELSEN